MISIIIRCKNEERWIGSCLQAVFNQEYKNFEVILVDNKSTDKTIDKARNYPVKVISIDEYLPGKAINIGIKASKGQYIACLSGHCIPVNDKWLSNLLRNFDSDEIAGVYGRQEPMSFSSDFDKRDLLTIFGLDRRIQIKDSFFHNANSMIRRDVWERTSFDESVTNIEDRLWANRVLEQGYKIIYEPEASVYHYHGIHQDLNPERCFNVVRILEALENEKDESRNNFLELKDLNVVALIPVRGDMKTLYLHGHPLLDYTIQKAKESKYIKRIIVSTDDPEMAEIARRAGAETPFLREPSLTPEYVDIEKVLQFSVHKMEKLGILADIIVSLEITFPFRRKDFIDNLVLQLVKEGMDSVISAKPEFESCWIKEKEVIRRIDEGFIPRKFKQPVYVGIKGLGCATHPVFLREGKLLGNKVGIMEITDPYSFVEVRDANGLKFAEILMAHWLEEQAKNVSKIVQKSEE